MAQAVAPAVATFKLVLVGDGGTGKVRLPTFGAVWLWMLRLLAARPDSRKTRRGTHNQNTH
jgi:hypothetical protein